MPRTGRAIAAGIHYHVINRGNGRMNLFHKPADFEAFARILAEGLHRYPVDLLAWCLMTNHWHLVVRPREDDALGRLMGWVGVTHVRRHHAQYHTAGGGHLYQGRFKSFPVQDDEHFLTLCRYVEANPVRAKMVSSAAEWQWSSFADRSAKTSLIPTVEWPLDRPGSWSRWVNQPMGKADVDAVRTSVVRDRPFGSESWVARTARKLGLEYSLRPRGRPKLEIKE